MEIKQQLLVAQKQNVVGSKVVEKQGVASYQKFTDKHYETILSIVGGDESRVFSTKFGKNMADANQTQTIAKHTIDASHFHRGEVDVLVFPTSNEEVSKIMALCVREKLPIVAQGTLTGLEGGAVPYHGGVAVNMRLMRSVLHLYEEDLQVKVQTGIKKSELNEYLENKGLMFAVDPGSDSSIGGQLSTGASGTLSVAHGTIRENVLQIKVVLPDENGTIITTRTRALKSSTGFDLTHLFVGSEGLLGIILEATLKIISKPPKVLASRVIFNSISDAAKTVIEVKSRGVSNMARCELINKYGIMAVNKQFNRDFEVSPTLFFEFHGADEASLKVSSEIVEEIAKKHGGREYLATTDENEQKEVWHARRNVYYAAFKLKEGKKGDVKLYVTDVCVPVSKLADIIELSERDVVEFNENQAKTGNFTLPPAIVGHVGDGNFHFMIPYLDSNKQELETILQFNDVLIKRAIERDGTCSGEHGVGIGKQEGLYTEHDPEAVNLMRVLKRAIDKNLVLNTGKVFEL
ncbi:hypothetical protein NAEGRDRAFT_75708 [Naegleria gruberi]|uniref:D-lactate dehydrogenase (cytochrome) n=1 Tax=Naegleria gruberi TaxID=5762 RepID=D2W2T7_NAEGR|nr:uncharacterized protein NAEGRDRAFT_75708 [Naegleria gruberi]EFC36609.1 hypothetical protein NAEGRDRAFT_75708 [Naegleria gruberi]|eukprot:XP_002669353.1 hypothetical protein NAEGRDRAFT_75708 [Naegleria gruberi strain NEG-M]